MVDLEKKIGFYGGSFDPIHNGHIHLALSALESSQLDEVWFSPTFISPHKLDKPHIATPDQRIEMLKLALEPIDQFKIYEEEAIKPTPSYTIDCIHQLQSSFKHKFYLILTEDFFQSCHEWKSVDQLLDMIEVIIGRRRTEILPIPPENQKYIDRLSKKIIDMHVLDISSTVIRNRLQNRQYVGHLLPPKILDYISNHQLY